jgi:hypothetical protein
MAAIDVPMLNKNRDMKSLALLDLITKNRDLDPEATVVEEKPIAIERTITEAMVADHHMAAIEKEVPAPGKIEMPVVLRGDLLNTIETIHLVITITTEEIPTDPLTIIRVEIIITLIEITIEVDIGLSKIEALVPEIIDFLQAETRAATKQVVIAEIMMAGIEIIKTGTLLVTI